MTATRFTRWWDVGPVAAANVLLAVAHARWPLVVPLLALLLAWPLLGRRFTNGRWKLLGAGLAGAVVGGVLGWFAPTPAGPVPPVVLGPLTGLLAVAAVFLILSDRRLYAWTYAGLLVALCQHGTPPMIAAAGGVGFFLALLACGLRAGGVGRSGRVGIAAFSVFLLLAGPAAGGIGRGVLASEGAFMEAIARATGARNPLRNFGLEDTLTLSRHRSLESSDRVLLLLSAGPAPLLRTTVLEHFDGQSWVAPKRATPELPGGRKGARVSMTFVLDLGGVIPVPAGVNTVEGAATWTAAGEVVRSRPVEGKTVDVWFDAARVATEPLDRAELTELPPELRAELLPLAREIVRGATMPREQAERIAAHFRDQHEYTLDVDLAGRGSALAVLIRERRPAYCTYFASAMAALLRSLDVPARIVGGFAPPPPNPVTGERLIRERDAHAWVEVWLDDVQGFVAMDPTPWRSREHLDGLDREPGTAAAWLEAGGLKLRRGWLSLTTDPLGTLARIAASPITWAFVAALAAWTFRRRIVAAVPRRRRAAIETKDPELIAARRRFARLLRVHGDVSTADSETDAELLARLRERRGPELAAHAARFVDRYQAVRFGGERGGEVLRTALDAFERAIKDNGAPRG